MHTIFEINGLCLQSAPPEQYCEGFQTVPLTPENILKRELLPISVSSMILWKNQVQISVFSILACLEMNATVWYLGASGQKSVSLLVETRNRGATVAAPAEE
jgi:hypothetical protein